MIDIKKFQYIRKSKEISQEQIAQKLKIKPQNVSMWENGKKEIPVKYYEKLYEILGVENWEIAVEKVVPPEVAQTQVDEMLGIKRIPVRAIEWNDEIGPRLEEIAKDGMYMEMHLYWKNLDGIQKGKFFSEIAESSQKNLN